MSDRDRCSMPGNCVICLPCSQCEARWLPSALVEGKCPDCIPEEAPDAE